MNTLPFQIDPLTLADIPAVQAVEAAAYLAAVPHKDYTRELENPLAHYLALKITPPPASIIGVAGYWLIADEAHVITIATHPRWQNRGLGEWLLLALLADAQTHGAAVATLEVRPSNRPAIGLYQKYGFELTGDRPKYYPDTGEDALIFTTPPLASAELQALLARRRAALWPRLAQINVDNINQNQPG